MLKNVKKSIILAKTVKYLITAEPQEIEAFIANNSRKEKRTRVLNPYGLRGGL